MMIQAVLGNPHHPEYGVATIPLPIPRDQYAHCIRKPIRQQENVPQSHFTIRLYACKKCLTVKQRQIMPLTQKQRLLLQAMRR